MPLKHRYLRGKHCQIDHHSDGHHWIVKYVSIHGSLGRGTDSISGGLLRWPDDIIVYWIKKSKYAHKLSHVIKHERQKVLVLYVRACSRQQTFFRLNAWPHGQMDWPLMTIRLPTLDEETCAQTVPTVPKPKTWGQRPWTIGMKSIDHLMKLVTFRQK